MFFSMRPRRDALKTSVLELELSVESKHLLTKISKFKHKIERKFKVCIISAIKYYKLFKLYLKCLGHVS